MIVHQDRIIGEGYHAFYGGSHAEIMAIQSVEDKSLLPASTLYVSLEPCNHYGNTPPCSEAIIKHHIPRVVIGMEDPNPQVAGSGIERLQDAGMEVVISDEIEPYRLLNKCFWVNQTEQRPFIVLKWAVSQNGFVGGMNELGDAFPVAITGRVAKEQVHALRAYHHAIMVGRNTVNTDNPQLTTRYFPGNDPLRIIFDRNLSLSSSLKVFTDGKPTIVLNAAKDAQEGSVRYFMPTQWTNMRELAKELYQQLGISSILVEGGTLVLQQFIDQHMYDELYMYQGKISIRYGVPAPVLGSHFHFDTMVDVGHDKLFVKRGGFWLQ